MTTLPGDKVIVQRASESSSNQVTWRDLARLALMMPRFPPTGDTLMPRLFSLLVVALLFPASVCGRDWPEWLGSERDGVWRETGLVKKFPKEGPTILWRAPLGSGYSGPAVVGDRVYVMDRLRATDKDGKPLRPTRDGILGKERVVCLDATSGKIVWKHEYDCAYTVSYPSGPRVTPLVRAGRVYTLGTMGDLYCLDATTGKPIWHNNLMKSYSLDSPPVWGYAAHPLLEGDLIYTLAGGKGSAVVALHKDTGKEVWKALTSEEVGYSPPVLVTAGGKKQLIVWLSDSLNGLDPATGKVYWTQEYPIGRPATRPAVTIITPVRHDNLVLVSSGYHGVLAVKLDQDKPAASVLWAGKSDRLDKTDGLHSVMATPVVKDGYLYGVCSFGELRCLELKTGKRLWQTFDLTGGEKSFCGTAFLVPQGDRFVAFNDHGELILAELSPKGHKVISRTKILDPLERTRGRIVVWSHPAFARKCVFARNDKEMVCVSLAEKG
jgi:outer membrane protein assembly factor BamB